jgi:hypothetical protein
LCGSDGFARAAVNDRAVYQALKVGKIGKTFAFSAGAFLILAILDFTAIR